MQNQENIQQSVKNNNNQDMYYFEEIKIESTALRQQDCGGIGIKK